MKRKTTDKLALSALDYLTQHASLEWWQKTLKQFTEAWYRQHYPNLDKEQKEQFIMLVGLNCFLRHLEQIQQMPEVDEELPAMDQLIQKLDFQDFLLATIEQSRNSWQFIAETSLKDYKICLDHIHQLNDIIAETGHPAANYLSRKEIRYRIDQRHRSN